MGGKTSQDKHQEEADYVDPWGKFDLLRVPDGEQFAKAGGDETMYRALTPEQRTEWNRLAGMYEGGTAEKQAFVKRVKGGSGAAPAAGGAAAAGAPDDPYMQAATPGVNTPWGNQRWTKGADGTYTMSSDLSPGLAGVNTSLESQWADALSKPLSGESARKEATDAAYAQSTSRLDPQWDKRQEAMRTQLLNQGLDASSEAYKGSMSDFGLQRNDAYTSAMNAAQDKGREAGDSLFRNQLAARNNPASQMSILASLLKGAPPNNLLNAFIAQKNNEMGLAGMAQQNQTDQTQATMEMLRSLYGLYQGGT